MNFKAITILAVRLMGLYGVVLGVSAISVSLGMLSSNLNDPPVRTVFIVGVTSTIWHIIIGGGLWYWSIPLGNLIAGDLPETAVVQEFSLESIQIIAVSLLGIFVLTSAIPDLISLFISWLFPNINPKYMSTFDLHGEIKTQIPLIDFIKVGIQLIMGLWLLLGSHSIVSAVRVIRKK